MLAFHIGGQESDYVRVQNLHDNGDGWFSAEVELVVGGFRAKYPAYFNSWAFSDFCAQLQNLYETISGSASFKSYERQLEMTLACDPRGHVHLEGEAMDFAGTGNKLIFRLEFDQSYVPKILADLRAALAKYPPRTV